MTTTQSLQLPLSTAIKHLNELFETFQALESSFGASIAALELTCSVDPAFDHVCHRLERDCADLQTQLEAMRHSIDLLPIHAVIVRLFPGYHTYVDEQGVWELEGVGRSVFESRLKAGDSEGQACNSAHAACVAHALKQLDKQDLFDLPDDMCWLIQGILEQVKMLLSRRKTMRP